MHFSGATIFNPRPGESPRLGEDGGWQIEALCPDGKIELVTGFKSKEEIVEWLASGRCQVVASSAGLCSSRCETSRAVATAGSSDLGTCRFSEDAGRRGT